MPTPIGSVSPVPPANPVTPDPSFSSGMSLLSSFCSVPAGRRYAARVRRRLRQLGYAVGRLPTGERNSLVDVPGVRVGHTTLNEGERLRTGVTAILPHGGNLYSEKV